jgi:hypothetical protein
MDKKEEEKENVKPFVRVIKGEMCVFCDIDNYLSVLDFDQHHPRMEEAYVLRHLSKEAAKKKRGVIRRIHIGYYCRECDKIIHKDEYPKLKEGQTKLVIEKIEKEWHRSK